MLWDSMDCSPPGSSVHGISQARILEWVAISFSMMFSCFTWKKLAKLLPNLLWKPGFQKLWSGSSQGGYIQQWRRILTPPPSPSHRMGEDGHESDRIAYCCLVTELWLTLCDPMDWGPPGSSVHGIFLERILEWVVISFPRASSWPKDWTHISCTGRKTLYHWATREAP